MIRKAEVKDLEQIMQVLSTFHLMLLSSEHGAFLDPRFGDALHISNQIVEYDIEHAFVAEMDRQIVGCSHYLIENGIAKTTLITVLPEFRSHGFGAKLQEARMKDAYEKGCKKMITYCPSDDALNWYQKHFGYQLMGTEERMHDLYVFHTSDRTVWAIHYGDTKNEKLHSIECDLEKYFSTVVSS